MRIFSDRSCNLVGHDSVISSIEPSLCVFNKKYFSPTWGDDSVLSLHVPRMLPGVGVACGGRYPSHKYAVDTAEPPNSWHGE
jgi:hypothetical protein